MSPKTTNQIGILITILAGTYFYLITCSTCVPEESMGLPMEIQNKTVEARVTPGEQPDLIAEPPDSLFISVAVEIPGELQRQSADYSKNQP